MTEEAMMETAPFRTGGRASLPSNHATGRDNGATELNCSLQRFDVMAIHALYQSVP